MVRKALEFAPTELEYLICHGQLLLKKNKDQELNYLNVHDKNSEFQSSDNLKKSGKSRSESSERSLLNSD